SLASISISARRASAVCLLPYTTRFRCAKEGGYSVDERALNTGSGLEGGTDDGYDYDESEIRDSEIGGSERKEAEDRDSEDNIDEDRKSTRLNSSHVSSSYAVVCLNNKF